MRSHVSTHTLLAGNGLAVRGKVRPRGRHRVKLVIRGTDRGARGVRTKANGTFALRWRPEQTGSYAVRAFAVHDYDLTEAVKVKLGFPGVGTVPASR